MGREVRAGNKQKKSHCYHKFLKEVLELSFISSFTEKCQFMITSTVSAKGLLINFLFKDFRMIYNICFNIPNNLGFSLFDFTNHF